MKLFFLLLLLLTVSNNYCQNFLVQYEIKSANKVTKADLIFNDTISLSRNIDDKSEGGNFIVFFFKLKNEKTAYFTERVMNQNIYVRDSIYLMKWELHTDTATVLNEKCLSAKTSFRGRNYTAFYAPKFSVDEGPWKFGGLPGLILAIKSDDNFIEWQAVKIIENYSSSITLPNVGNHKFIGWTEFVQVYKETVAKLIKSARSNGTLAAESSAKMKLDAVEIFYPELQTGEGINF